MDSNVYSADKLWEEALNDYGVTQHRSEVQRLVKKITDDWKGSESSDNTDRILDYVETELTSFKAFRNPPRKDRPWSSQRSEPPSPRLREMVRGGLKSLAMGFKNVSDMAGQGAGIGFPPAGLIVAVVGHIAGACLAVSADYDLIEQLFRIMDSFTGRLRLLDDNILNRGNYHKMISLVFCKMLEFCTHIRRTIEDKKCRIFDFAKALWRGEDQKLREAYDGVVRQIDELDKATVMQTLAVAVGHADQLSRFDKEAKKRHEHTWELITSLSRENKKGQMHMEKTIMQTFSNLIKPIGPTTKSVSASHTTLESVTWSLSSGAEPYVTRQLRESTQIQIAGTCDWVLNMKEYAEFHENRGFLSITGGPGTGKSVLTAAIFWKLKLQFESDPATSVAFFTFDKNIKQLRSLSNMLSFCAAQVARSDIGYGERIRAKIEEWDDSRKQNSNQELWSGLFEEQFKTSLDSQRMMYLVVDGADQLDQKYSADFASFIRQSAESSLNISFVVAGDFNNRMQCSCQEILLDKEAIRQSGDFRRATVAQLENFHNLSRLRPQLKRSVADKISKTADSFLYIDHALRSLDMARSPFLISKRIKNLPNTTQEFYQVLVDECRDVYYPEEQKVIGYFLAWLAHCQEDTVPLSLGAAQVLLKHAIKLAGLTSSLRIEDQVSGRLSRHVILSVSEEDSGMSISEQQDKLDDELDGSEGTVLGDADINDKQPHRVVVTFQEPSLRDFFQQTKEDAEACDIRPSKLDTHFAIVRLATNILSVNSHDETADEATLELRSSAAKCWAEQLLLAIRIVVGMGKFRPDIIEEVKRVTSNLGAIRELEKAFDIYDINAFFWGSTKESSEECIAGIKHLVSRGADTTSDYKLLFESIAQQHIQSWLESTEGVSAYRAHLLAYYALMEAGVTPFATSHDENGDDKFHNNIYHNLMRWGVGKDGVMQPKHYSKISIAQRLAGESSDAQEAAEEGIRLSQTRQERLEPSILKAQTLFYRWVDESGDKKELADTTLRAFYDAETEVPDDLNTMDDNMRNLVNVMYQMKAKTEAYDSRKEIRAQTVQSMRKAKEAKPEGFYVYWFDGMIAKFGENKMWGDILELLELLPNPLSDWCSRHGSHYVHKAAKVLRKEEEVRKLYAKALEQPDPHGNDIAETRLILACFERFVMAPRGDQALERAKELLWVNIHSQSTSNFRVRDSAARLADILLHDFLTSETLEARQQAYDEVNEIQTRLERREGFHFNHGLSKTSISLLIMKRRLGTAREFYNEAIAILKACLQALSDHRAGNDIAGLWQLTKILALLPGCVTDAQIASTCIYYNVTPEQGANSTGPLKSRYCDFCRRDIEGIEKGCKSYSCFYCSDIDLCEKCYTVRQIWYDGKQERMQGGAPVAEDVNSYLEVCPKGHHYLEVPPKGWKGFSDGKIKIDDWEEEFSTWRDSLEEKWKKAWEENMRNADRMAEDHLAHPLTASIQKLTSRYSFEM
ncbi:hypothetical protein HG531_012287 [Fusarium graminearum]|nr:hypothetical protein HG531_012287 [Fusarium graminearum]